MTAYETRAATEDERDRLALLTRAAELERNADLLYWSLLAPSMAERAMREDARKLRESIDPFDIEADWDECNG